MRMRLLGAVFAVAAAAAPQAWGHCGSDDCGAPFDPSSLSPFPSLDATRTTFNPLPDRTAVLVIGAHPDDEGIFFGGALPYYSQIRNLPTVLVSVTSGDWGPSNLTIRENELRNAAGVYGLQYEPIFPRFRDVPGPVDTSWDYWGDWQGVGNGTHGNPTPGNTAEGRRNVALYLAQQIRDLRPEVIATHEFEGDYGHGNHQAVGFAVAAAWDLAAGRSTFIGGTLITPDSLTGDAWEASKVYMRGYNEDPNAISELFHLGWEQSRAELGGDSARDVANAGLAQHASQNNGNFKVSTIFETGENTSLFEPHHSEVWGLFASAVGADTETSAPAGYGLEGLGLGTMRYGDFFENVDLTPFARFLADSNGDGVVGNADLDFLLANWGEQVPLGSVASGDADGDGVIGQGDLDLLIAGWGEGAPPAFIPEPGSFALLGLGLIALNARRRKPV